MGILWVWLESSLLMDFFSKSTRTPELCLSARAFEGLATVNDDQGRRNQRFKQDRPIQGSRQIRWTTRGTKDRYRTPFDTLMGILWVWLESSLFHTVFRCGLMDFFGKLTRTPEMCQHWPSGTLWTRRKKNDHSGARGHSKTGEMEYRIWAQLDKTEGGRLQWHHELSRRQLRRTNMEEYLSWRIYGREWAKTEFLRPRWKKTRVYQLSDWEELTKEHSSHEVLRRPNDVHCYERRVFMESRLSTATMEITGTKREKKMAFQRTIWSMTD